MSPFEAFHHFTKCDDCGISDEILNVLRVRLSTVPSVHFTATLCKECRTRFLDHHLEKIYQIENLGRTNVKKVKEAREKKLCSQNDEAQ